MVNSIRCGSRLGMGANSRLARKSQENYTSENELLTADFTDYADFNDFTTEAQRHREGKRKPVLREWL